MAPTIRSETIPRAPPPQDRAALSPALRISLSASNALAITVQVDNGKNDVFVLTVAPNHKKYNLRFEVKSFPILVKAIGYDLPLVAGTTYSGVVDVETLLQASTGVGSEEGDDTGAAQASGELLRLRAYVNEAIDLKLRIDTVGDVKVNLGAAQPLLEAIFPASGAITGRLALAHTTFSFVPPAGATSIVGPLEGDFPELTSGFSAIGNPFDVRLEGLTIGQKPLIITSNGKMFCQADFNAQNGRKATVQFSRKGSAYFAACKPLFQLDVNLTHVEGFLPSIVKPFMKKYQLKFPATETALVATNTFLLDLIGVALSP